VRIFLSTPVQLAVKSLKYKSFSKSGFSANWLYEYRFCTKASVCASVRWTHRVVYTVDGPERRHGYTRASNHAFIASLHDIDNAQPAQVQRFCVKFELRLSPPVRRRQSRPLLNFRRKSRKENLSQFLKKSS
jgi:hypothetical protein